MAIANEKYEISDDYAVQLAMPKKVNLLRAVSRKQQKTMCLQILAPVDRNFDIPDVLAPFLLQDSGEDDKERILIFGDSTMKNLLNCSNTRLVDGTFQLSLEIFYQIYTIHVELNGFFCYFHLTQSFNRKINENGLKIYYENFPEFNLALRMLPALAHVPPAHVKACFVLVIEEITDVIEREQFEESVVEKMDELEIYFKSTYTDNPFANKKLPFPIEMWNQYDAGGEGIARTTNSVEGWHYGLQAYFNGSTPNNWMLLRNLGKDSKMHKFKYVQETAGLLCSKRR